MKTNLRKLGSMVMAVGMMSALTVTAFAAESIPATKLTASTVAIPATKLTEATVVGKTSDSIPMTKIVNATNKNDIIKTDVKDGIVSTPISLIGNFQAASGHTLKTLADGNLELVNKETGEKISVVMAKKLTQSLASSSKK